MWEKFLLCMAVAFIRCQSFTPNVPSGPSPFLRAPPGPLQRPAGFPMMNTMYSEISPRVESPKSEPFIPGATPFYGHPGDTLADIPLNPRPQFDNFDFTPPEDDETPVLNVALDGENLISIPNDPSPPGLSLENPEREGFPSSDSHFREDLHEEEPFIEHPTGEEDFFLPSAKLAVEESDMLNVDDSEGREADHIYGEYDGEEEDPVNYEDEDIEVNGEGYGEDEEMGQNRNETTDSGFERYEHEVEGRYGNSFLQDESETIEPRNHPEEEFNPFESYPSDEEEPERLENYRAEERSSGFQEFHRPTTFENRFSENEGNNFETSHGNERAENQQRNNFFQEPSPREPQPPQQDEKVTFDSRPVFDFQRNQNELRREEEVEPEEKEVRPFGFSTPERPQRRRPIRRRGHESHPSNADIPSINERENSLHDFDSFSDVPSRIISHPKPFLKNSAKRRRPYKHLLESTKSYPEENQLIDDLYPHDDYEDDEEPDRLSLLLQQTKFNCLAKKDGYYADEELGCEVFHFCQDGVRHSWLCPSGASFHQVHLICMPQSDDNICEKSSKFHFVNDYLYKEAPQSTGRNKSYVQRYYPKGYEEGIALLEERQSISDNPSLHQSVPPKSRYQKNEQDSEQTLPSGLDFPHPLQRQNEYYERQPQPNLVSRFTERVPQPENYEDRIRFDSPNQRLNPHHNQQQQQQQQIHQIGTRSTPIHPRRAQENFQRLGGFRVNEEGVGSVRRAQRIHQRLVGPNSN